MIIINGETAKEFSELQDRIKKLNGKYKGPFIVATDTSRHSIMYSHLITGYLMSSGIEAVDLGPQPYPIAVYEMSKFNCEGMIYLSLADGTSTVECLVVDNLIKPVKFDTPYVEGKEVGKYDRYTRCIEDYKNLLDRAKAKPEQRITIIIDGGNGTGGAVYKLFDDYEVKLLYGQLGEPQPFATGERLSSLKSAISMFDASLGIMFDSSCRKVLLMDGKGKVATPEQMIKMFSDVNMLIVHDRDIVSLPEAKNKLSEDVHFDSISLKGLGITDDCLYIPGNVEDIKSYDPICFAHLVLSKMLAAGKTKLYDAVSPDYSVRKEETVTTGLSEMPQENIKIYEGVSGEITKAAAVYGYVKYFRAGEGKENEGKDQGKVMARVVVKGDNLNDVEEKMGQILNEIKKR